MESASVEDGAQIDAGDSITLVFSKNVCEASVRDANKALVLVKDAQGADVPATVVLADDQVEPDKKNDIVITFDKPLQEGAYTVTAQAGITSKSGDVLAEDYVLHFTVASSQPSASAGSASASAASSASAAASAGSVSANSASTSSASTSVAASASSGSSANQQVGSGLVIPIAIGVVVIVVVVGAVVLAKKKK